MSSVSVILSGYRRNYSLKQQYEKIVDQSYKVKDIYFYKNDYNKNIKPHYLAYGTPARHVRHI